MNKKKPIKMEVMLERYERNGEKTGWTFILLTSDIVQQLSDDKRSFRLKGKMDNYVFKQVAAVPIGHGEFIIPVNAVMRKATGKKDGDKLMLQVELDTSELLLSEDLLNTLATDEDALRYFQSLARGHQQYFSNWIETAKTMPTKSDRLAKCLFAMQYKMDYGQMIRHFKKDK